MKSLVNKILEPLLHEKNVATKIIPKIHTEIFLIIFCFIQNQKNMCGIVHILHGVKKI